ncbi:MAG: dctA [Rickettsiales bacterium]|jgi:aerobic C4-dicarboxylate transport protein|nr:dctA [Rickettsiales bacterium]
MKHITRSLYFWVLVAIVSGGVLGYLSPEAGIALKPIADGFIALIKMLIGPVIFCTVVLGIAGSGSIKKLGRVGGKALLYFEVISTFALVIGLLVGNLTQVGAGLDIDPATLDASKVSGFSEKAHEMTVQDYILHIIPKTFADAFTGEGDLLQILLVAILFGIAMTHVGEVAKPVITLIESLSKIFFKIISMVMTLAPIGAGAAMAYTIGKFGAESLQQLAGFVFLFYATCAAFVFIVLGVLARICGFSLFKFLRYIKTELITVLGTSSSESVIVQLMHKLEKLGCHKTVIGIVVPAGYSFNLDGTNIYLSMAVLFVSHAVGIDLSLQEQLTILAVAMLTSKGASGVTGSGFITLAATLAVVPSVPVTALALILGIDRFMSEARAVTNMIGNGVAAIVISKWEKALDEEKLRAELG